MMDPDKIVKFTQANIDFDEDSPLDREKVIKNLAAIPQSVANEYAYELALHFEDWLSIRNIILAIGHPETLKTLVETLPEYLYSRLNKIAFQLALKDPGVDEIVSATLNIVMPTEASRHRAADVIKTINAININREAKAKELMNFAKNLQMLVDTITVLDKRRHDFNEFVLDHLSRLPDRDLDDIMDMAKSLC